MNAHIHPRQMSSANLRDARDAGHPFCVWSRTRYQDLDSSGRLQCFDVLDFVVWCDGEVCNRGHVLTQLTK